MCHSRWCRLIHVGCEVSLIIGVQGHASAPHSSSPLVFVVLFCVDFSRVCAVGRREIVTVTSASVRHMCLWVASLESRNFLGSGVFLCTAGGETSVMGLSIYGVLKKTTERNLCVCSLPCVSGALGGAFYSCTTIIYKVRGRVFP